MGSPLNEGLGSWTVRCAAATPQTAAIEFEGRVVTYAELDLRVRRLADALRASGVRRGDRVAYVGLNHPALLELLFAAGQIGAIAVLVNARLAQHEVDFILDDSGAQVVAFTAPQAELVTGTTAAVRLLLDVDATGAGTPFEDFLLSGVRSEPDEVLLDDVALIMYTSGTTGSPKGAMLTHGNLFFNDVNVLLGADIRPDEVCLAVAPMFHIAGLNGLVLPVMLRGGTIVVHRAFVAGDVLATVRERRITSAFAVPAMMDALERHESFPTADLTSLRTLIVGGAPVPERTLRTWSKRGVAIQQGYGQTETSPSTTLLRSEHALSRLGSAGKASFFVDTRIVGPDGQDAAPGEAGQILTRGRNVFVGYWNREADTAASFTDGWLRTGDVAVADAEGFYFLRDRMKDMYISGGENIYPAEVENALLEVDGVAEAAVVGVPDERWGEVGRAFIVVEPGATLTGDAVRDALADRLAPFKIPRHVEVVDALPRTSTGKIRKHELRGMIAPIPEEQNR